MAHNIQRPKRKSLLLWGFLLIFWFLLPLTWKVATKSSFEEFHAPVWEASTRIQDLTHFWGHVSDSKKTLIEKGRDHQRILSDAKHQISSIDHLEVELQRLKELKSQIQKLETTLELEAKTKLTPTISRISLRNLSGWNQSFRISKGQRDFLQVGNGVISFCGIVGRLEQVYETSSQIQLISNKSFRMVAHLKGDNRPVTFQGNGVLPGGQGQGILYDIPADVIIPKGNDIQVVSSNLSGTYPKGLHIGIISELTPSVDGVFKVGKVLLSPQLSLLSEVTILKYSNAK